METIEEVLSQQHQEWLRHPVTQQLVEALKNHKNEFVKLVSENASNKEVTDSTIRIHAASIKCTDAITVLVTNTQAFLKKVNNKQ